MDDSEDTEAQNTQISEFVSKVEEEISHLSTLAFGIQLNDDTKQVAVMITGYVMKKIKQKKDMYCI